MSLVQKNKINAEPMLINCYVMRLYLTVSC